MARLKVFNHVTLDGYFTDKHNDMSWPHNNDAEWNAYANENASGDSTLVFGRITYEMMERFWPTAAAQEAFPAIANKMNNCRKIVFSTTLNNTDWQNTTIIKEDLPGEISKLKSTSPNDMVILGSGTIVAQLTKHELIDEYEFVINPVIIGSGRTLFEGIDVKQSLKLVKSRTFNNGNVVLQYERFV